jgi:hypothetical protein
MSVKKISRFFLVFILITAWVLAGGPVIWQSPRTPPGILEVLAATETIRPTDAYSQESWTTPANAYDGNINTNASYSNVNKTPSISFGGASSGEAINAWASKSQTWTSATLYLTFSKTAGTDDTVEVLVTDQNGTLKHTIVSSTAGVVTKQEFSQVLNSADWGDSGFPNIANLRVRVNGSKSARPDEATSCMYDIRIDGEYTPATVSVSVSDGVVSYSVMPANTSKSTLPSELNDMQTAKNGGNVTENFNIKGQNSTNWTLASTAGSEQYVHRFCNNTDNDCSSPPTNYTALTIEYQALDTGIAVDGTVDIQLQITTPTTTNYYTEQQVNVTIQAVQQ